MVGMRGPRWVMLANVLAIEVMSEVQRRASQHVAAD
jgi:hypothetical protein